ncbi:hypothetical protein ACGF5C_31165 [Micromonospora sp. NPDC047620]|uniref:hypothetical protein n=1 Tax=Micromonospora sp. NPDC047620 TaxID=3364251 RepID=UPI00371AD610
MLAKADHALAVAGRPTSAARKRRPNSTATDTEAEHPPMSWPTLIADFADVVFLLQRPQPAATRIALTRIMGQLGGMAAVVLQDLGNRREADSWFATAARSAEGAGDRRCKPGFLRARRWCLSTSALPKQPLTSARPTCNWPPLPRVA